MNDVERLTAAFDSGRLLRPSADIPNIVDLASAVASASGATDTGFTKGAAEIAGRIGTCDHLVFIIADGLGMELVETLPRDSFLRRHLATELRTVFPSTTSSVLTTLSTAEWPGRHAVIGWDVYIPQIDAVSTIIKFVRRSDDVDLASLGVHPSTAYPAPSILPSLSSDFLSLAPESIADSPYSRYYAGETARLGFKTLAGAVDRVIARVERAYGPTSTNVYWDAVDLNCHAHGTGHTSVRAAIQQIDLQVERLSTNLPDSATLVLTADHGHLGADKGQTHTIKQSDRLVELLEAEPSGDKRVVQFHVRDGAEPSFRDLFRERYDDRFALLTVDEAEELQLFGPGRLATETRRRLGSLMAISIGADVIRYHGPTKRTGGTPSISHHSGLTPSEMRVPLIVA